MKRDVAVLALALVFPTLMAGLYFVVLAGPGSQANPAMVAAFGLGKIVQFSFPVLYVWWWQRDRLRQLAPSARGLGLGLGFGLATAAAMLGLYFGWLKHSPLTADTPEKVFHKLQEFAMDTPAGFIVMAAAIALVHSLLEEYYWRWFVFGGLRRCCSLPTALGIASLGFMAHHVIILAVYFPGQPLLVGLFALAVAAGGGVWAWIYERSRSLSAAWLSHLVVDGAIMVVGFDMVSRFWR